MPETWSAALAAVTNGIGETLNLVTGSTLLMAMSFGFVFVRKGIGVVKKLIRIGGKN